MRPWKSTSALAGVAEASDLRAVPQSAYLPTAIRLRGRQGDKLFLFAGERKDDEGDTTAWEFISSDGFTIHILND